MYKLNKTKIQFDWITHDSGLKFKIRPFSIYFNTFPNPQEEDQQKRIKDNLEIFKYVVLDWEGLYDEKEIPLTCDEENKKLIYDFDPSLTNWVITKSFELRAQVVNEEELKN